MLLPDLRIRNYRLFKEFNVRRLARVNLIGGMNNTGKSSLLEAAYLVANPDVPSTLDDVLKVRGEGDRKESIFFPLFYGYRLFPGLAIEISSGDKNVRCSIPEQEEIERILEEIVQARARPTQLDEEREPALPMQIDYSGGGRTWRFILRGEDGTVSGGFGRRVLPWGHKDHKRAFLLEGTASLYGRVREMARLWDDVSMTPQASDIIEALRIIEPRVKSIDFLRAKDNVKVLLEREEKPILIGSLGDGVRHLLMIALLLVGARGGALLVDEVDTGLHYTVLIDLWRLIFQTTKRLNVQVLATTHSWDCITAFSQAWNEAQESEGLFLRLDRKGEYMQPVSYTREELGVAAEQRIEMR